jgi:hypothetical protein
VNVLEANLDLDGLRTGRQKGPIDQAEPIVNWKQI